MTQRRYPLLERVIETVDIETQREFYRAVKKLLKK